VMRPIIHVSKKVIIITKNPLNQQPHPKKISKSINNVSLVSFGMLGRPLLGNLHKGPIPARLTSLLIDRMVQLRANHHRLYLIKNPHNLLRRQPLIAANHILADLAIVDLDVGVVDLRVEGHGGEFEGICLREFYVDLEFAALVGAVVRALHCHHPLEDVVRHF
jgi:hypothetical protein